MSDRIIRIVSVHAALAFVQISFGAFYVVSKLVIEQIHPLSLAGVRVLFAAPLLLIMALVLDKTRPHLRDIPTLALLGLFGVCLNQLLFIIGLKHTTAMNAAILMPSIPVFAAGFAVIFKVERFSVSRLIGILIAVTGALVVLEFTKFSADRSMFWGNVLILLNCVSYSIFLVMQRPLLQRLPALTTIAWSFVFGGMGVLAVTHRQVAALATVTLTPSLLSALAFIIFIATILNYYLNTWAVQQTTPSLVAAYITLQPVTSAFLSIVFLSQKFTSKEIIGLLLILGGLSIVTRTKNRVRV